MEWSKLKNIILLLLIATNLCLLAFVLRQQIQREQVEAQSLQGAVSFLAGKGVSVDESLLPKDTALLPQTVERDLAGEESVAATLLQGNVRTEALGSEVYRYSNENGFLQFHSDGAFSGEFTLGAIRLGEDWQTDCLSALGQLGFQGEIVEETERGLLVRQIWSGVPLFTQQVTLICEQGCLTALTGGRRLVGEPAADSSRTPITTATALIDFFNGLNALGDVCSSIDRIDPGYVSAATLSGPITLTPVWRITTDTGAYQLDMITGALTRVTS